MKIWFSFFLLANYLAIHAQTAVITGTAAHLPGEMVRVIIFDDQFSHLEKTLAATYSDAKGNFLMKVDVPETTYAFLAVGLKKGEFYLKPAASYNIEVIKDTAQQGSVFDEIPLQFILKANDGGLNEAIGAFNENYNRFIYENANRIYKSRDKKLVNDFRNAMIGQYSKVSDPYFIDYIDYTLASLNWVSATMSPEQIISNYFSGRKILYHNIQYTDFFAEFFKAYFGSSKAFTYLEIKNAINAATNYNSLDAVIKRDSLLVDEQLRELSVLTLLARKYYSDEILQQKVIMLFNELEKKSKYEENRKVAADYLIKLRQNDYGSPAPGFYLKDSEGNVVSLKQFEGKFILLNFVKDECKICMNQFQQLYDITEGQTAKLQLITIVYGKNFKSVVNYARERSFNWPILSLDKDILLLEKYNIKTYPAFVIINPDGTFAMATAPMPDELLDLYIKRFMNQYEKEHSPIPKK